MYIQRFISGTTYSTYMSKQMIKVRETDHEKLNGHNVRELVKSNIYVKNSGYRYIKILNFKSGLYEEFLYLGFTKAGNPKFGKIISFDSGVIKIQKKIGKINGNSILIMGGLYQKSIDEVMEAAFL